jgi:hypothetical protein
VPFGAGSSRARCRAEHGISALAGSLRAALSGLAGTLRLSIDGSPWYGDLPAVTGFEHETHSAASCSGVLRATGQHQTTAGLRVVVLVLIAVSVMSRVDVATKNWAPDCRLRGGEASSGQKRHNVRMTTLLMWSSRALVGLGWDLAQGAHEPDDRLIAFGGQLLHGRAEVLCLLVQQCHGGLVERRGAEGGPADFLEVVPEVLQEGGQATGPPPRW